jgi:Sulfotransferase domain
MAHAKNMAHRAAILEGADILVNLDADNFTCDMNVVGPGPSFAQWITDNLTNPNLYGYCIAKSVIGRARQGLAGRIAVHRNVFLKVGGYDERWSHWAPEDEDFKSRINRMGGEGILIPNEHLYVIHHKDGLRFKEYPHAKPTPESEALAIREIRESTSIIANYGHFGEGTVYRNFSDDPIHLGPLPTRIFGIGMHKTGTTSLYTALKIMGYDSAHWVGPWWARDVWREMQEQGRSVTLEKSYAMCDLPFTFLFRELDKAYPGSKFILTLRDEDRWVESVRNHWALNSNRYAWDQDCFSHKCHTLLYGQRHFDAEVMLNRYRQHNAEVREYFEDRPADLLEMNMDENAGWKELCRFLGQEEPEIPYPQAFVTKRFGEGGDGI